MCFRSEKGHVELAPHESRREVGGILAHDGDFDVGQLVSKDAHGLREPVHLLSGQEAKTKRRLGGLSGPPCRFASRLDLNQRQPGVIEEDPTRLSELNAASASGHELGADLVLEIPDLTT